MFMSACNDEIVDPVDPKYDNVNPAYVTGEACTEPLPPDKDSYGEIQFYNSCCYGSIIKVTPYNKQYPSMSYAGQMVCGDCDCIIPVGIKCDVQAYNNCLYERKLAEENQR